MVREWIQGETWHSRQIPFSGKAIKVHSYFMSLINRHPVCDMEYTCCLNVKGHRGMSEGKRREMP